MKRIEKKLKELSQDNQKAFVGYIVAGDPDLETSLELMHLSVDSGVDILEIGVPFTDPIAEGPTIQQAHDRSLENETNLQKIVDLICKFLREIILEPYGVGMMLISHLDASGRDASGAKRWTEVAGWVGEIRNCVEDGQEDQKKRKLLVLKDPINDRKFLDYTFKDGVFTPTFTNQLVQTCYPAIKTFVQEQNMKTGQIKFTRKDFQAMRSKPSQSQLTKNLRDHLERGGIFKRLKDKTGREVSGIYLLKPQFQINKSQANQLSQVDVSF